MNTLRTLATVLFISTALIACNDSDTASPAVDSASTPALTQGISAGMSVQAVTAQLGEATLSQTSTLDELTFTQSEWTTDAGTTSVQFINDKVQYSQFTAAEQD